MDKKTQIKKRFVQFLKDNGIFNLYRFNTMKWHGKKIKTMPGRLFYFFPWSTAEMFGYFNSIESYDFWEKQHEKWIEILKEEFDYAR